MNDSPEFNFQLKRLNPFIKHNKKLSGFIRKQQQKHYNIVPFFSLTLWSI